MKNLRRQTVQETPAFLTLAADARFAPTSYTDDQVWDVYLNAPNGVALAFATHYGGRRHQASLACAWGMGEDVRYLTATLEKAPVVSRAGVNYCEVVVIPFSGVQIRHVTFVLDSQTLAQLIVVENRTGATLTLDIDLFVQLRPTGNPRPLEHPNTPALALGNIDTLAPVLLTENGVAATGNRIRLSLSVPARKSVNTRWVHVGLPTLAQSLARAQTALKSNWKTLLEAIDDRVAAIPQVTGEDAIQAQHAINALVSAVMSPSGSLKYPFLVGERTADAGYSASGGTDYGRAWALQDPYVLALTMPLLATIDPEIAKGMVRNFLAIPSKNGMVSMFPSPNSFPATAHIACPPMLAHIVRDLVAVTQDTPFAIEVLPALIRHTRAWLDHKSGRAGVATWHNEKQSGYLTIANPDMPLYQSGVDVTTLIAPDLFIALINECEALNTLGDTTDYTADTKRLRNLLEQLHTPEGYAYADADTGTTGENRLLLDARADASRYAIDQIWVEAARLVVQIPALPAQANATVTLFGADSSAQPITETLETKSFKWHTAITRQVFTALQRVEIVGLSKSYRVVIRTNDLAPLLLRVPALTTQPVQTTVEAIWRSTRNPHPLWALFSNIAADMGIDIASAHRVRIRPALTLVEVRQHGVIVTRTTSDVTIVFPSGVTRVLSSPQTPLWITDEGDTAAPTAKPARRKTTKRATLKDDSNTP